MNCVRPLRLLRATVRGSAWSSGPRILGTWAEASAAEQPGLGICAVRVGCASTFRGDTAAAGMRVISSAGGINPLVCAATLDKVAGKAGIDLNIAVVTGDDIMREKEALQRSAITDIESEKMFPDTMRSVNVYLGHSKGFLILECSPNGQFVLSKAPGAGGLVSFGTVAEQRLYEVSDPQWFLLPDVTCDFSQVSITEIPGIEGRAVHVQGAKGSLPSSCNKGPQEVVLWLSVHHKEKKAVEVFSREIVPAGTGMVPGLMGVVGGHPKVSPVLKPFFFLYPKQKVKIDIHLVNGGHIETLHEDLTFTLDTLASPNLPKTDDDLKDLCKFLPLVDLPGGSLTSLGRSGLYKKWSQGNSANIGHVEFADPTKNRYELPGIYALNFLLKNSLHGGGTASLRGDPQGKALEQRVLDLQIKDVPDVKSLVGG